MKKALFSSRPITAKSVLERRRRRVISLVASLPEASAVVAGETTVVLIGEPKPVVASQPVPAENPVTSSGLFVESNSSAELLQVVNAGYRPTRNALKT